MTDHTLQSMEMTIAAQYRRALEKLSRLIDAKGDSSDRRRREIEGEAAFYAERLKALDLAKGRPRRRLAPYFG